MPRASLGCLLVLCAALLPAARSRASGDAGPPPACPYGISIEIRLGRPWEVPASIDGVVVRRVGAGLPLAVADVRVELVSGADRSPLAFELDALSATDALVRPAMTLAEGSVLEVSARACDDPGAWWITASVVLTAPRAEPAGLGTIELGELLLGPGRPFTMSWAYSPSEDAVAWRNGYWAALELDGVVFSGDETALGRFVSGEHLDAVSIACEGWSSGLVGDGAHTLRLAAGLWGRPASVFSDAVEVTIECPEPWVSGPPVGPDGCRDSGHFPDGGPAPGWCPADTGPPLCHPPIDGGDGFPCPVDAGARTDVATGCSAAPSRNGRAFALALIAALACIARRRR